MANGKRRVRLTAGYVPGQRKSTRTKVSRIAKINTRLLAKQDMHLRPPEGADIAWARLRGVADGEAGELCSDYDDFVARHNLSRSDLTLRMWSAYMSPPSDRD